jgi:hypothetical protein
MEFVIYCNNHLIPANNEDQMRAKILHGFVMYKNKGPLCINVSNAKVFNYKDAIEQRDIYMQDFDKVTILALL